MSVQLLTFKTQQSIIGDVTEDGDFYKVKKPTQVFIQPSQEDPGRTMMGFAPYLEFCEEFFKLVLENGWQLSSYRNESLLHLDWWNLPQLHAPTDFLPRAKERSKAYYFN